MDSPQIITCNGAAFPKGLKKKADTLKLDYQKAGTIEPNIKVQFPNFMGEVYYLPPRIKDLLELAAYVYSADRLVSRGRRDSVEYHNWARSLKFIVKVRDIEFWNQPEVKSLLNEVLTFMSGDREFIFLFESGHETMPFSLFDRNEFQIWPNTDTKVILFSGGLDSLAGAVSLLEETNANICLVSHRSNPSIKRTQEGLYQALEKYYPGRVKHYKFDCNLSNCHRIEETQRTRAFLYNSIAFSLATAYSQDTMYVHENGITSLNFSRRQDLINARASRTTHPKTLGLLGKLFTLVGERHISIQAPFLLKTKTDVVTTLKKFEKEHLIPSAISCSRTFTGDATHCGSCFQCVDRRLAMFSAGLNDIDDPTNYCLDFVKEEINDSETRTTLIDYLRLARWFSKANLNQFYHEKLAELVHITQYISNDENEAVEKVWKLCRLHGQQIWDAICNIRNNFDDPFEKVTENSFLRIISQREYILEPVECCIHSITERLGKALPIAFQKYQPNNENDLNDKISAILEGHHEEFQREHPAVLFGLAKTVPDHAVKRYNLLIETKFLRKETTPSKASDGIAADLIKYPKESYLLFIVYDPFRSIHDDESFAMSFEKQRKCKVYIIR